jgi:hypothetical protein
MNIKYCEITIIHNYEDNWVNNIKNWLGYELFNIENSDIILLFDDDTIYDVSKNLKDFDFQFFVSRNSNDILPIYFKNKKSKIYTPIYFKTTPFEDENNLTLNFSELFKFYDKYKQYKVVPSIYNCIYFCYKNINKPDVFSIVKTYSNEDKPRFLLAYDSEEFDKETIIYLINCIFKNKYNTNVL